MSLLRVQQIIDQNGDVNALINGSHPLRIALFNKRWDLARILLNRGVTINLLDPRGPLYWAVRCPSEHVDIVQSLLELGCDPNLLDDKGETVAFSGIEHNSINEHHNFIPTLKLLIEYGLNINIQCRNYGTTILHIAIYFGKVDIVKLLLESGADTSLQCHEHETAMQVALRELDIVRPEFREPRQQILNLLNDYESSLVKSALSDDEY